MPASDENQYRELANAIAQQAEALALGKIPDAQRPAQVRRLLGNVETLLAWTGDQRAEFATGDRVRIGSGRTTYEVDRRGVDDEEGRICLVSEQTGDPRWVHPDRLRRI